VNWIVVARYTSISFIVGRDSNEKFCFCAKRNSIAEADRPIDAGTGALEMVK